MFELRSHPDKKPIIVNDIETLESIACLVLAYYDKRVLIKYPDVEESFEYMYAPSEDYKFTAQNFVDAIILGNDFTNLEISLDYGELFKPIFEANEKLVAQYKDGNEKALNALLGKFLKDNKGVDPKAVKEELIKLLS